jgi:hypothetical protein
MGVFGVASAFDDPFRRKHCYPEVDTDRPELVPCLGLAYGFVRPLEVGVADVTVADGGDADAAGVDGPE